MTEVWLPAIYCQNPHCPNGIRPIFLPYPNPPSTSEGQPNWPKDTWRAFLACHYCERGYSYAKSDVRWEPLNLEGESDAQNFWILVEAKCVQENCGLPIRIFFFGKENTSEKKRDSTVANGCIGAACELGHFLAKSPDTVQMSPAYIIE